MLPHIPKSPRYRRLWLAGTISELGDWSARLTIAALIFEVTGDPAWVGIVSLAFIVPRIGLGQFLTGWSERLPRRPLLVISDSARAVLFLIVAFTDLSPAPLLILVLIAATIDPVFDANASAATFDALSDDDRDDGVRFRQVTILIAQVAGIGAAGVALGWFSPQVILVANAISFAVSALIISGTSIPRTHEPQESIAKTLATAARVVFGDIHMRAALITTTITIFAATAAEAQVIVFAESQPSWVLPTASAAIPLAAAVGAAVASTEGQTKQVLRRTLRTTTLAGFIAVGALGVAEPWAVVLAFACVGLMFQTVAVGQVIAVRHLPIHGRASVLSLLQTVVLVGSAGGAAVSGFAMNAFGLRRGIQLCLALAVLAWLAPLPRDIDDVELPTEEVRV